MGKDPSKWEALLRAPRAPVRVTDGRTRKAARQTQRWGSRSSSPRPRACANASATASLAHFAISGESHEGAPQTGAVLPSARPSPTHPAPHPYRAQF